MTELVPNTNIYWPSLPIKGDKSLRMINGPEYSISLSTLKYYEEHMNNKGYQKYLCGDIIKYVLNLESLLETNDNHAYYQKINMKKSRYIPLKIHILEAIECFKYAVAQGYPVSYVNTNTYFKYDNFDDIINLFFIDNMPETREFIVYYLGLFPDIINDKKAIITLVKKMIAACDNNVKFDKELFKDMLYVANSVNISLNYIYYDTVKSLQKERCYDSEWYDDEGYNAYSKFIQVGIDNGLKLNTKHIEFIREMEFTKKIYLNMENFDKYRDLYKSIPEDLVDNYNEWHSRLRDIINANIIKTEFVINNRIEENGSGIVNINLAHVAHVINKYY